MSAPNDLNAARNGDINAFHRLFSAFQPQLRSYLYRLVTTRGDADDLVHDTFVRAFDKLPGFREQSSLKTWTFRIATNLAIDQQREQARWPEDAQDRSRAASQQSPHIVDAYLAINARSAQGQYEIKEHIDFCFTCISKTLPMNQQVALLLKDVYGFKVKESAQILGQTVAKTQHQLHQARHTMKRIFANRCSLINKQGICYQCSELNGLFNPEQDAQLELIKINLVQEAQRGLQDETLLELRTQLVSNLNPLDASGTDLHDFIMQRVADVSRTPTQE
jgi:RNA polymerase sigma-70 factor (ECF subfamily)